jgi:NADPH2:quinone reductase
MRAVVFERCGEPDDVLFLSDVPEPELPRGHVRVRMLFSPVNPSDLMTIRGVYTTQPALPAVPGYEGVGIVEAANAGLYGWWLKGKRVAVLNPGPGNWQEVAVVPVKNVIPVPGHLSVEQAAMFFVNPATAYVLTHKVHALPKGAWLLQTAAGSAVGQMVIRLGRQQGFRTCNIVRREDQAEKLRTLGADAVLVFDPATDDAEHFVAQVRHTVGPQGVRYAIDPVGGDTASALVDCLGEQGKLVLYGTLSPEPLAFSPRTLMTVGASVEGFWLGKYVARLKLGEKIGLIQVLGRLIQQGVLSSDVAATYSLNEVRTAVRAAEQPGKPGKVLLRIREE